MPSAQNRRQPISPAAPYSMMLVIHARIMKLEIAIAPWAACGMPRGANQSATGTTTQITEKMACHGRVDCSALAVPGMVAVTSVALMKPSLRWLRSYRSEEYTSELQSHVNLVCRL